MKKITVTLSDKAEKYFNELKYSIDEDSKVCTSSRAINWALEAMADFEKVEDQDLVGFLEDRHQIYSNPDRCLCKSCHKPLDIHAIPSTGLCTACFTSNA